MPFDLRRQVYLFGSAVQFLTRLPVPASPYDPHWLPRAAKYFPLVGIGIGIAAAAVFAGAAQLWPQPIPAILAVGGTLLLTGALHEDGLADTADSFGGRSREARLAIMKDSRLGSFAVLALFVMLTLKVFTIAAVPIWTGAAALVAGHAAGRFGAVLVMAAAPYGGDRATAKVEHGADRPAGLELGVAAAFALLPLALLPARPAMVAAALGAAAGAIVAIQACRGLGGYTGDVLGAVIATSETAFLLGVATSPAG